MHKILSRNIIIYLLSHPMSKMINLHNLQNMIWTNLSQEILSSSTTITDKSVKWYVNKTYQTIKCFVIQHNKKKWNTKWHTNINHMWQCITSIVILTSPLPHSACTSATFCSDLSITVNHITSTMS